MKPFKLIFLIAICAFPLTVGATEQDESCALLGKNAELVMRARQNGVALSTVIAIAESEIMRKMVLDAYELPRYQTESKQKRAMDDYRDTWTSACYKAG